MTNIEDGSAEHATHSSGDVRANSGGAFANLTHLPHLPHLTGKDSLGSDLHPTSRNAPREPATVDDLIGSSAASPSEPAPSLRPVEEIERDLAVPEPTVMECFTDTPAWYAAQHRLAADIPSLLARLRAAEETLAAVGALFAGGPDTACRTVWQDGIECVSVPLADLRAALAEGASR